MTPEEQKAEIRRRMPGCWSNLPWTLVYAMYVSMSGSYQKQDWLRFGVGCLFWAYIVLQGVLTAPSQKNEPVARPWGWAGIAVTALAAAYCHLWH